MRFHVWWQTDRGLRRESNQDSILVDRELGLFIVADGMGGHKGGEVASKLAVDTSQKVLKEATGKSKSKHTVEELIQNLYTEASHAIYDKAVEEAPKLNGMGTTMVLGYLNNDKLYIGNVGDSRAYLFKNPHLWQLTEDHSILNEQLRAGLITPDQIDDFAGKNIITRSVGYERNVECDVLECELEGGDMFLLCSDGLTGMVTDEKIAEIIKGNNPDQVVTKCIKEAMKNGGEDNISVLVLSIDG